MTPSGAPRTRPAATPVALVFALGLIALAVVGVRDLAADRGWIGGSPWFLALLERLDGTTATASVEAASIALVVIGLALVLVALRPTRPTHHRVEDTLWLSPAALTSLAVTTADRTPGVLEVTAARSTRRVVVLDVVGGARQDPAAVEQAVTEAVRSRLEGLAGPALRVRVKAVV